MTDNIKKIGEGGWGVIYRDKINNVDKAIKKFKDVDNNRNFEKEKKILKTLEKYFNEEKHVCPNVLIPWEIDETNKRIIMDLYDGDLFDYLENIKTNNENCKFFNKETTIKLIKKLIYSIECLNKNNLFYSDLKPENILYKITPENDIQIILGDLESIQEINEGEKKSLTLTPRYINYLIYFEKSKISSKNKILFDKQSAKNMVLYAY